MLHEDVPQIREQRFDAVRLPIQPRIGIRLRRMGVVRACLPAEIAPVAVGVVVFALKALVTRPRFDQRPVDRKVFVGHPRRRLRDDQLKKALGHGLRQEPIPILREDRRCPDEFIQLQAHEPAEQDVVIELLHEQPFAAHRVEQLQELRPQEPLRRNRRPAASRVERVERRRHLVEQRVDQEPHGPQGVIRRDTRFRRHVTEQGRWLTIVSSHAAMVERSPRRVDPRHGGFFSKLVMADRLHQ